MNLQTIHPNQFMHNCEQLRCFRIVFRYFSSSDFNLVFAKLISFGGTIVVRRVELAFGALVSRIIGIRGFSFRLIIEEFFDVGKLTIEFLG